MTRYADPTRCPDCGASITPGSASCSRLRALPARRDRARPVHHAQPGRRAAGRAAAGVDAGRRTADRPDGARAPVAAPPPAGPAQLRLRCRRSCSPSGAGCLLVAALVFLAVTWSVMGVGGRTATLVGSHRRRGRAGGLAGPAWAAGRDRGARAGRLRPAHPRRRRRRPRRLVRRPVRRGPAGAARRRAGRGRDRRPDRRTTDRGTGPGRRRGRGRDRGGPGVPRGRPGRLAAGRAVPGAGHAAGRRRRRGAAPAPGARWPPPSRPWSPRPPGSRWCRWRWTACSRTPRGSSCGPGCTSGRCSWPPAWPPRRPGVRLPRAARVTGASLGELLLVAARRRTVRRVHRDDAGAGRGGRCWRSSARSSWRLPRPWGLTGARHPGGRRDGVATRGQRAGLARRSAGCSTTWPRCGPAGWRTGWSRPGPTCRPLAAAAGRPRAARDAGGARGGAAARRPGRGRRRRAPGRRASTLLAGSVVGAVALYPVALWLVVGLLLVLASSFTVWSVAGRTLAPLVPAGLFLAAAAVVSLHAAGADRGRARGGPGAHRAGAPVRPLGRARVRRRCGAGRGPGRRGLDRRPPPGRRPGLGRDGRAAGPRCAGPRGAVPAATAGGSRTPRCSCRTGLEAGAAAAALPLGLAGVLLAARLGDGVVDRGAADRRRWPGDRDVPAARRPARAGLGRRRAAGAGQLGAAVGPRRAPARGVHAAVGAGPPGGRRRAPAPPPGRRHA